MKYLQFKIVLCAVVFLFPGVLIAQTGNTNGTIQSVKDSVANNKKDPVTATDSSGTLVQTAFRKVRKEDLLGGTSFINVPQIMKKNYFTYSLEGMQAYVGGFNGHIWGMGDYLVLVDGIPRDASSVLPSSIQQITFLKGISAVVLYGSRAANGVVYISTKRGGDHPLQISGRVDGGLNVPITYPKYLGSAEYMTLYNEARQNDGLSQRYDPETIYRFASGKQPYRYPNVNYYSPEYLKKFDNRYDGNVEISGGNSFARFYTNINFSSSGSLLNFGEGKNNRSHQFNIRGNVDLDISDNISATIGTAVIYDGQQGVNADYWGAAATLRPNQYTPLIPVKMFTTGNAALEGIVKQSNHVIDDKYLLGGTQLYPTNPIAGVYAGGTSKFVGRQYQFNTGVNIDLKGLLEGLTFHSMIGVDYRSSYNQGYNDQYAVYEPVWTSYNGSDQIAGLTKYGDDSKTGIQNVTSSIFQQTLAFSGRFNYNHTINDDQYISAMLIANGFQITNSGVYHRTAEANLGLQLGYNYRHKYYVNFSAAVPHSAKLPKGNRNAFSPTVSLGWRISDENFMSGSKAIDNLKLTVSAGIVNTDLGIPGYYLYSRYYSQADGAYFSWRDGLLRRGTESRHGQNLNLTYVKRKEINAGIEASFFDNLLTLNGTVFLNRMDGGVVQPAALYPNYFMTYFPPNNSFLPYINYNVDQRKGVTFNVNANKEIGSIQWSLGVAGMYFDSKAIRRAEVNEFDYQNRAGTPLDGLWGLESQGFFMSQQDIDSHVPQAFGTVKPGDLKYKDQNGDGLINAQDQVYLGKAGYWGAPLTFGVHLSARWKNWTLFALGTGQKGAYAMKNSSYYWISGNDKYSVVVRNRWTEQTKNTATYPRLTTQSGSNDFRNSSFWMYSTDRFDLRKVQITYNIPQNILRNLSIRGMQVYVSGFNLLTISPNRDIMELNIGGPPQTRFYNVGIKASF